MCALKTETTQATTLLEEGTIDENRKFHEERDHPPTSSSLPAQELCLQHLLVPSVPYRGAGEGVSLAFGSVDTGVEAAEQEGDEFGRSSCHCLGWDRI